MKMILMNKLCAIFIGLSGIICSCASHDIGLLLSDVETYVADKPDSALTVLSTIDRDILKTKRIKAHHALLQAMALDKNYIDVSDDSLARVAVDYYSKHGPERYKARSFYYLGIAYYYQKNYTKAILEFTKAEQSAIKSDSLYLGMSLLAQADSYSHTYNDTERLSSLQKSLQVYSKLKRESSVDIVNFRLAQTYSNMREYDIADSLYQSLLSKEHLNEDLRIDIVVSYAYMMMSKTSPNYQEALKLYYLLETQYDLKYMSYSDYWSWAYALLLSGNREKSDALIRQLSEYDSSVDASYWKYCIARANNDYDEAFLYLEDATRQQNVLVTTSLNQSLSSVQRDYFRSQSELSSYRLAVRTIWVVVILSLSLLAIALISVIVHQRIRKEREEKEKILQYIDEINRQFNIPVGSNPQSLKSKFIALYKSRFEILGELCNQYFAHDGYEGAEQLMYKRVWSLIEDVRNDKARREKFEKLLDDELNGIMSDLRTEMPKLNEQDYALFSFLISGFDMAAISRLLDMSLNNVYAHKRRLRLKIEKKQPPHAHQFLEMIS